ncbi:SHOCT domain-containing protein [Pyrococcus yayanosii]|nr:SHOCT domain-containing protein [Pyrococcus yayanosii]
MGFGYFGILGAIFMLLFWIAIIVAVALLIKWIIEQGSSGTSRNRALEILDEKYARGEINDEEYERRKRKLLES